MEPKLKKPNKRSVLFGSYISILFVFGIATSCVFLIKDKLESARTQADNVRAHSWVHAVLPDIAGNITTTDLTNVVDPIRLGTQKPASVYEDRPGEHVIAIKWRAEKGYNGGIDLALAVNRGGKIVGIAVLAQNETRGFGDVIQSPESKWIQSFEGRSLKNPLRDLWQLRSNGGEIDGLSGATITANAVVNGVAKALRYLESRELER